MARHKSHLTTKTRLRIEFLENRCLPTIITPTTFADGGLGSGSLRDAVLQFNADAGTQDDIIQLLPGTYSLTIQNVGGRHETAGLTGDLNLTQTTHRWIIQGAGSSTIIDGSQLQDRVFQIVNPGTQVVFQDLVIQGGLAQDNGADGAQAGATDALGGGILNNGGRVTLDNVVVQDNVARGGDAVVRRANGYSAQGAGIYSTGGTLTIAGATITANQGIGGRGGDSSRTYYPAGAGGSAGGGGLYATSGTLDISDSRIANNGATGGRGGDGGTYRVTGTSPYTVFLGGTGGRTQGGGLYVNGGSLSMASSTMASNQGTGGAAGRNGSAGVSDGGGLYIMSNAGTPTVMSSTLSGNSATSGGGIDNAGTLMVTGSTLAGNTSASVGGGIANSGTLTVTGSTLSANSATTGGAISNGGTLTVTGSTLSANSATGNNGSGGGISNGGTLTVTDSTLSGNCATGSGGTGGGIYNSRALTVSNSTLSGNVARGSGGGIATNAPQTVTFTNVTLTANRSNTGGGSFHGGGLFVASGTPLLHNTLIAGNLNGSTGTIRDDVSGTLFPGGDYDLIGDGTGMTGLTNGVNLVGSAAAPIDPLLGPLQNNGGPTQTNALLPGSPAIDAGDNGYATPFDQRGPGFPRVLYGGIDIGAFELERGTLLTVTSTLDQHSDGLLSLREAVNQANTDARQGQSDTTIFDPSLGNVTITLSAGPLELSGASATATEIIDGSGRITVSGADANRVFQIDAGVQAELDNLTITHGRATDSGGGIANAGTLTVAGSALVDNVASDNGGAIANAGTMTVTGSTLAGNTAALGGGIFNNGTLTVRNSTLAGNTAARDGGGLWEGPTSGPCAATNVTISANRANTGGSGGAGAGLFVDPAARPPVLHNTLIAGNFKGATGTSRDDVFGALDPAGDYNLIGDGTGMTGLNDGVNGNQVGSAAAPIDPLLGLLQDNGGSTPTMALLPGSPAAAAGNNAYADGFDQRGSGFLRVLDGRIDIGAFEQAPALLTVTSAADIHRNDMLSLREALDEANRDASRGQSDTITFADSLGNATITLSGGPLELYAASATTTLTIVGGGRITVSGNGASRVFQIDAGVSAELDGLTIANGRVTGSGGGISNSGTLTVAGSTLSGNSATNGGGISNGGTLTITDSTLSGNSAINGGGISNGRTLTITGSTLSANSASYGGGGIYNSGTLTISDSTLSGSRVTDSGFGGGIYNSGILTISDSTLSGNAGTYRGGGIYNYNSGRVTVSNSTLSHNSASGLNASGGGIYSESSGTVTVSSTTLSGNSASFTGGGIENFGPLTISDSTLSSNSAHDGGAIYSAFTTVTINNSTLSGNSAAGSGGIANYGTLTISNSTLSGNRGSVGGIYTLTTSPVTLTNVTITANRATNLGGGLDVTQGQPVLHNTLIAGNFRGATGTTRDDVDGRLNAGGGYNLIGDGTGMTGLSNGVNGNQVGSASAPIDPLLDSLGDYGGPTRTHALLPGSPAVDAGDPNQLGTPDQRGVLRTGGVNVGAYQASVTAFRVGAPDTVPSGAPFDVTVTAVDPFGQVAVGYTGTVTFSTTDPDPGVVLPADYTFTADDGGVHVFSDTGLGETTLLTPGDQVLIVTDRGDGTIIGSATVTVDSGGSAASPGGSSGPFVPGTTGAATTVRDVNSSAANAGAEQLFTAIAEDKSAAPWLWWEHRETAEPAGWVWACGGEESI
jgi:hypothetical protein